MAILISFTVISCSDGNQAPSSGNQSSQTRLSLIDNVMELAEDSTERRFENIADAYVMLVYKDSILIVSNKNPQHGAPLISLYDINCRMHHVADYIPRGSSTNEMTACRIHIATGCSAMPTTPIQHTFLCWTGMATLSAPTTMVVGFKPYHPARKQAHST